MVLACIKDETSVVSVCSRGAALVTSTLCDAWPSVIATSTRAVWFSTKSNGGRTAVSNPLDSTLTSYCPTGRRGKL